MVVALVGAEKPSRQAHADATYALDFVSLVLSGPLPRQAEMSLSPYARQHVPLGSVAVEAIQPSPPSSATIADVATVSRGWKSHTFGAAADKLSAAATRLEDETVAESHFWDEVLAIRACGWPVCRLPRERHTLGVQCGGLEAAPVVRDRSLVALRRGPGGRVVLDQGLRVSEPRSVRIRIESAGRIVGVSTLVPVLATDPETPLADRIRCLRDSLFEEELFHELSREARTLLRHGVDVRRSHIRVPLNSTLSSDSDALLVDLISPADESARGEDAASLRENALADAVAQSLRILLAHAHRHKFLLRTQIPPPVSLRKRPTPEFPLIQPSATYLRHRADVQWLEAVIGGLCRSLNAAGIPARYTSVPLTSLSAPIIGSGSAVMEVIDPFLRPLQSTISGTFISPGSVFRLRVRTNLAPAARGTEIDCYTTVSSIPEIDALHSTFTLRDHAAERLGYLFTADLVYSIPGMPRPAGDAAAHRPTPPDPDPDAVAAGLDLSLSCPDPFFGAAQPGGDARSKFLTPWCPAFPAGGLLTAWSPTRGQRRRLTVQPRPEGLRVRAEWGQREDVFGAGVGVRWGNQERNGNEPGSGSGGGNSGDKGKGADEMPMEYEWRPEDADAGVTGARISLVDVLEAMSEPGGRLPGSGH